MDNKLSHSYLLHDLLLHPKYRIWRHVLLIVSMFIVALNQTYIEYELLERKEISPLIGTTPIIAITLIITTTYLITIYCNIYLLIPQYLFKRKYTKYFLGVIASIILLVIAVDISETLFYIFIKIPPGDNSIHNPINSSFIDSVFIFSLLIICIIGGTATALFRQWEIERKDIIQLNEEFVQLEIEELKERISPNFLLRILNKAGKLSIEYPEISSEMLFRLSKILRYQLYDCSRKTVLLSSEIQFTHNYLELYKQYNDGFNYEVSVHGEVKYKLVSPLLFISLIQIIVDKFKDDTTLRLKYVTTKSIIDFQCISESISTESFEENDFDNIRKRLKLLYKEDFSLSFTYKQIDLQILI